MNRQVLPTQPNVYVCPNCHQLVTLFVSPGGLSICPSCSFSPSLGKCIQGDSTPSFIPPIAPIVR